MPIVKTEKTLDYLFDPHELNDISVGFQEDEEYETKMEDIQTIIDVKEYDSVPIHDVKDEEDGKEDSKNKEIDPKLRYECEYCSKLYSRRQTLEEHILSKHSTQKSLSHECKNCSKKFVSEKKLRQHEFIHLPADKKFIHPCPYCDKK